jgi:hypothetical protein
MFRAEISGGQSQGLAMCGGWHLMFEQILKGAGIQTKTLEAPMSSNHLALTGKIGKEHFIQTWDRVFIGRTPDEVYDQYLRAYNSATLKARLFKDGKADGRIFHALTDTLRSQTSRGAVDVKSGALKFGDPKPKTNI